MFDSNMQIEQPSVVVDLAEYRRRPRPSRIECWNADREYFVSFRDCLLGRIKRAEANPKELMKLAVAFDLRRIKLMRSLTFLLSEDRLFDRATLALSSAERLKEEIAVATPKASSVCAVSKELVHTLDDVIVSLRLIIIAGRPAER